MLTKSVQLPKGTLYGKLVSYKGFSFDHDLAEIKKLKIGDVLPIAAIQTIGDYMRVDTKKKGSYSSGLFDFYSDKKCTKPVNIRDL